MRNLKKFLALVLAMMMVFSLMITVNAASTSEAADTASRLAAAQLGNYGVMKGYDTTGTNLGLGNNITRAEMAAIVYRIMTGDIKDANDEDNSITNFGAYAGLRFSDVDAAPWAVGYIGFCASQGILKGFGDDTVRPNDPITGYQVQTMLLRAVGYGQNHEYEGDDWRIEVATDAAKHNIFAITTGTNYNPDVACPRGIVAQMTLNAATGTRIVRYNASADQYTNAPGKTFLITNTPGGTTDITDAWGVPGTRVTFQFNWNDTAVTRDSDGNRLAYTIDYPVLAEYTWAETECDVADEVNDGEDFWATIYTNGYVTNRNGDLVNTWDNQTTAKVEATETVKKIGATGRWTRIYDDPNYNPLIAEGPVYTNGAGDIGVNPGAGWTLAYYNTKYIIVYVDDLLAEVTNVTKITYDRAGHPDKPASISLNIFDGQGSHSGANGTYTEVTLTTYAANYEYEKGDYVIVNAWQCNKTSGSSNRIGRVYSDDDSYGAAYLKHVEIIPGVAESFPGKQTLIIKNSDEHEVNGETISDDHRFVLNEIANGGRDMSNNYRWFVDQYGYLIGAVEPTTEYDYGVVTDIQWINNRRDGYALADLILMNGETLEDVVIEAITLDGTEYEPVYGLGDEALTTTEDDEIYITTSSKTNADAIDSFVNRALFRISLDEDGETATLEETDSGKFDITAKNPVFTGKGNDSIRVNDGTMFLISSGSTFKAVTGFKYDDYTNVTVYYVNVDGDDYVEFALILGNPVTTVTGDEGLLYVKNGAYTYKSGTYTLKGVNYNGEEVDMTTKDEQIVTYLTDNIGGLFYVSLGDGKNIDGIVMISGDYNPYAFTAGGDTYCAEYVDGDDIELTKNVIKWENKQSQDMYINISDATEILYNERLIGWNELNEYLLKGYNVYVVYDTDNVAVVIYVTDEDVNDDDTIRYATGLGDITEAATDDFTPAAPEEGETIIIPEGMTGDVTFNDEVKGNVIVEDTEHKVTFSGEVSGKVEIGEDAEAVFEDDVSGKVEIGEDAEAEFKGEVSGEIVIGKKGKATVSGEVTEDASITFGEDSELVITGTGDVTVDEIPAGAIVTVEEGGSLTVEDVKKGANITVSDFSDITINGECEDSIHLDGDADEIDDIENLPENVIVDMDGSQIQDETSGAKSDDDRHEFMVKFATDETYTKLRITLTHEEGRIIHEDTNTDLDDGDHVAMICPADINDATGQHNKYVEGKHGEGEETPIANEAANNILEDGYWTIVITGIASDGKTTTYFSGGFTVRDGATPPVQPED